MSGCILVINKGRFQGFVGMERGVCSLIVVNYYHGGINTNGRIAGFFVDSDFI